VEAGIRLRYRAATVVTWTVREAAPEEYEAVRTRMWTILRETEGQKAPGFGREFWEWQYVRNELPSVVVIGDDRGKICGYFHVLVFPARHGGRPTRGAMIQDVASLPEYRKQGLLRAMDAEARRLCEARGAEFILGFPNERSLRGFTGLGTYTIVARVPVYVRPLDTGRLLASRVPLGPLARVAGAVADPLYRALRVRSVPLRAGDRLVRLERFEPDVDGVAADFAEPVTFNFVRSARYLQWRFMEKPTREYGAWGVRRDGRLVAYAVTRQAPLFGTTCVVLMDFGCRRGEEDTLLGLVAARLGDERRAGAALCVTMGLHPFFARLARLGFVRVPERLNPRLFHFMARGVTPAMGPELLQPDRWLVTLADWDVM